MKNMLTVLCLFFSFAVHSQLNMLLRNSTVIEADSFLDVYPGAVAAYSLTYLTSGYFGNDVIQVRRSSDGTTQGFTPAELQDGTAEAFCGAGNGRVATWEDQLGVYDLTQSDTEQMPFIVEGGVLVTAGGLNIYAGAALLFGAQSTGRKSYYALFNSTSSGISVNGVAPTVGNAGTAAFSGIFVGSIRGNPTKLNANYDFVGKYQELIIYNSNESANKAAIEAHRNDYYSIY